MGIKKKSLTFSRIHSLAQRPHRVLGSWIPLLPLNNRSISKKDPVMWQVYRIRAAVWNWHREKESSCESDQSLERREATVQGYWHSQVLYQVLCIYDILQFLYDSQPTLRLTESFFCYRWKPNGKCYETVIYWQAQ